MRIHPDIEVGKILRPNTPTTLNYTQIPPEVRIGHSPTDRITLYKGAITGRENFGFLSYALEIDEPKIIESTQQTIEHGTLDEIQNLFDRHTDGDKCSGLISTSPSPQFAQVFAPYQKEVKGFEHTIYCIEISAERCVIDRFNTGKAGTHQEILVLGAIHPKEIIALKTRNWLENSELITTNGEIRLFPDTSELNPNFNVKDPQNWLCLR